MTMFAEQAHQVATRDRVAHVDQLLDVACREAIGILRVGRVHGDEEAGSEAVRVLVKAGGRAERVLGVAS